jgi:hypothetical protein
MYRDHTPGWPGSVLPLSPEPVLLRQLLRGLSGNPLSDPRAADWLERFWTPTWLEVVEQPRGRLNRARAERHPLAYQQFLTWRAWRWAPLSCSGRVDWLEQARQRAEECPCAR